MMGSLSAEALLAAGYAIFLGLVALVLELLARHSHRRSHQYRTAGFHYDWHSDAWQCPTGEWLVRISPESLTDQAVRYRAAAHICNACVLKKECTDSDEGRELQTLRPWLESELGKFHRGISIALLLLATLILSIAIVRNRTHAEMAMLLTVLSSIAIMGGRFVPALVKR
jgi:hypothetical protein